jgi:4-hydroxyphenylacetate 3-monooxygenase
MSPTVAAKKSAAGAAAKALPYTGREYLDSLDDGREIWIYGERVAKITEHPAFRTAHA